MKRWAVITVGLYLLVIGSVTIPLHQACYGWGDKSQELSSALVMLRHWGYWLWIVVSVAGQVLLLAVPVALGERRPRSRRNLMVPVMTAAFLFALVCVSAITALTAGIWGDHGDKLFHLLGDQGDRPWLALLLYLGIAWTVWAVVFQRFLTNTTTEMLTPRLMRWLLRGSILELLVAVPSHVISRNRHDCCAPVGTFWGIATGITVMLLSFGPGVFFLFVERMHRLQPKTSEGKLS